MTPTSSFVSPSRTTKVNVDARKLRGARLTTGGAFLSTVVLVELSWVLRVAYKFDRPTIAAALRRLVGSEGVNVEDAVLIGGAIDEYENGTADFSDYVILAIARRANALPLRTFDETLARNVDAELVP